MHQVPEVFAPVDDLGAGDALESWRWLVGSEAEVRLLSAMGDLFISKAAGILRRKKIFLVDSYSGDVDLVASSWEEFKVRTKSEAAADWLKVDLVVALREAGLVLKSGQCYSPIHPPVLGGSFELDNFEAVSWRVHIGLMGQIHRQVHDLPLGTKVKSIELK